MSNLHLACRANAEIASLLMRFINSATSRRLPRRDPGSAESLASTARTSRHRLVPAGKSYRDAVGRFQRGSPQQMPALGTGETLHAGLQLPANRGRCQPVHYRGFCRPRICSDASMPLRWNHPGVNADHGSRIPCSCRRASLSCGLPLRMPSSFFADLFPSLPPYGSPCCLPLLIILRPSFPSSLSGFFLSCPFSFEVIWTGS